MGTQAADSWDSGAAYERYVGRWSRRVAARFLEWIAAPPRARWADIGCGTGALTASIVENCEPAHVTGIDSSEQFVEQAQKRIADPRVQFEVGDAAALPLPDAAFDRAVSALVLNFVPDREAMVREMARVTKRGGTVALYVWDYAEGMQMLRAFWDAAAKVDPRAGDLDEARRFPVCEPAALAELFGRSGLSRVATSAIRIDTSFADFNDFWTPFLGKTGPAPAYLAALEDDQRERIRERLRATLPADPDGRIRLTARAYAVQGTVG